MLTYKDTGIKKYIFERICQIHDEILVNDDEYRELGQIPTELFHRLFAKLPTGDRQILDQYSSEFMKRLNRQDEILYSRGLMDGIFLCRWIDRIGSGEEKNIL